MPKRKLDTAGSDSNQPKLNQFLQRRPKPATDSAADSISIESSFSTSNAEPETEESTPTRSNPTADTNDSVGIDDIVDSVVDQVVHNLSASSYVYHHYILLNAS